MLNRHSGLGFIAGAIAQAQTFTGTASSFATAHRDVLVAFAGFGFGF